MSAMVDEYMPRYHRDNMIGNGVLFFGPKDNCQSPVGHFTANFWTATRKGFGAIQKEAEEKMRKLEDDGIYENTIEQYNFYRAISIVSEGIIHWSKRYAKECYRLAELETRPERKKELMEMGDCLDWIMENPCRNFHDAVQCIYLYQLAMIMDGQLHGISYGRVDQYLGMYYDQDIANGTITPEYAQEIMDLFYSLKSPYRRKAAFYMNDSTVKAIRKLKDSNGQYLWQPSLTAGAPDTLLNKPIYTSPYMPTIAAGAKSILFGDLSYYWVADREGRSFKRLNELFAPTGQIGFLASERVDGKLILPESCKVLQQKA